MDDAERDFCSSSSSSDDEGVEVDVSDDDEDHRSKLLHQLAVSLAQELKYSRKQFSHPTRAQHQNRDTFEATDHSMDSMELSQNINCLNHDHLQLQLNRETLSLASPPDNYDSDGNFITRSTVDRVKSNFIEENQKLHDMPFKSKDLTSPDLSGYMSLNHRLRMNDFEIIQAGKTFGQLKEDSGYWASGWNACTTEALRYLIEDEGLSVQHPTVVAMKSHLDLQRERAFTLFMEHKSRDMTVILD